jgi:hypothetical protein
MEEILAYQVLSLDELTPLNWQKKAAGSKSQCIELCGTKNHLLALKTLRFLLSNAAEIIYRENEKNDSIVVYSSLPEAGFLRPAGVKKIHWTADDFHYFEDEHKLDSTPTLELDVDKLWRESEKDDQKFLSKIFCFNPRKEKVILSGATSRALILGAGYFLNFATAVFYGDEKIK